MHHKVDLTVSDLTASTIIYSKSLDFGEASTSEPISVQANHSYQVTLTAVGEIVSGYFSSSYLPSAPTSVPANITTGGLRVMRTINHDAVTGQDEAKNYYYAAHTTLDVSSGQTTISPIYFAGSSVHLPAQGDRVVIGAEVICTYATLYSSSQFNLYPYNGSNVYYRYVTISRSTTLDQGAEEHEFIVNPDINGQQVWGLNNILSAPLTNSGWNHGLEKNIRYYKKSGSAFVRIKEIENTYVADTANQSEVRALVVRKKYTPLFANIPIACNASNRQEIRYTTRCVANHAHLYPFVKSPFCERPDALNASVVEYKHPCYGVTEDYVYVPYTFDHIDAIEYRNIAYWHYLSQVKETVYDENGENPLTNSTEYFYDNPNHSFLTRSKKTLSDGKVMEDRMKYIGDYNAISNFTTLTSKHIVNIPIKQEKVVESVLTEGRVVTLTDDGRFQDLYIYESAVAETAVHDAAVLIPSTYKWKATYSYNTDKNLQAVTSREGIRKDYIWGYNAVYPIAEVVQPISDHMAYTSFEADGAGNWTIPSTSRISAGYSGTKSYALSSGAITKNVDNAKVYIVSLWAQGSGAVSVNGSAATAGETLNGWTFYTTTVQGASAVTISGTATIDEVRLYGRDAQMSTYTYTPGVGITSVTDTNNKTTFFDYDTYSRLKRIKNEKGEITKSFEYNYINK